MTLVRAIAAWIGASCVTVTTAHAGGLVVSGGGSPRAIGRAGATVVGDDGGGALLVNPAAMARRDGWRGQVGIAFVDDEIAYRSARSAPVVRNQAPSSALPLGAVAGALGSWVIGLGAMTAAISERGLRTPDAIPPADFGRAFDHRYAGLRGYARRDTITVGVARRLGDQLALGAAFAGSRVGFAENRRIWAGFNGRDTIGNPANDVEIELVGTDAFVPSATFGALFVPLDEPIELGASIAWSGAVTVEADARAAGTVDGPGVQLADSPTATLRLAQPWIARAGARYLGGDRYVIEVAGELAIVPASARAPVWRIDGIAVRDPSSVTAPLSRLPSRASQRRHGALRAAVDIEVVEGFLWATGGYAYEVGAVESGQQSPSFGSLGGHTMALGIEAAHGGFTFSIGWSRTWAIARASESTLRLDNPFGAGDSALARATYDGSTDQLGILVDAELDAPE